MPARKTSPPEEEKPRKPVTKTKPTAKKTPTAKKPTMKKAAPKKEPKKTATKTATKASAKAPAKKTASKKPAAKNDNPPADGKKPRPRSPINGVELPEGNRFEAGEEAREAGRKGGKKSGEVRRARKTLREELLDLLNVTSKDSEGKEHTQQEHISAALIKEAKGGNVRAFETIRDTIGEKQQEKVEVAVAQPQFDALDAAFSKMTGDAP